MQQPSADEGKRDELKPGEEAEMNKDDMKTVIQLSRAMHPDWTDDQHLEFAADAGTDPMATRAIKYLRQKFGGVFGRAAKAATL